MSKAGRRRPSFLRRALQLALPCCGLLLAAQVRSWSFVPPPAAHPVSNGLPKHLVETSAAAAVLVAFGAGVQAASAADLSLRADLSPETFRPVCPASDGVYSFGKIAADSLLGADGAEYRPLAIEALLRARLEICVLESFVYEAIIPFIQRKGLGWILPLHETIDSVIAGTVFAIAINFILFGTTKILSVLSIYHDFVLGAPLRFVAWGLLPKEPEEERRPFIQINLPGSAAAEEEKKKEQEAKAEEKVNPVALTIGTVCQAYGAFAGFLRGVFEGLDTFVGQYLSVISVLYITFKWAHFRLFNDIIPF
eukprot:TRINITY_DN10576_c0_g1_i1.p1 TRINITY_DN10576_c0_g1~~TRINITY_DN10576_c0_g1_i1.p1  ORF type:complete len:309 (-),score=50.82 TRINITY_DN10576_c0_g1_i1:185-1111(-)